MVPNAQCTADSKLFSPLGLFQITSQFAFPLNYHHNLLILRMWTAPWDLRLYGHTQRSLPLMVAPFLLPLSPCYGQWLTRHLARGAGRAWMEAAVPAKPQNTFERRAGEPASTQGSAGRGGHSQRGNSHRCETGPCSWEGARDSAGAVL